VVTLKIIGHPDVVTNIGQAQEQFPNNR